MPNYSYDSHEDEFVSNYCINCYTDMSNSASSLCSDCEDEAKEDHDYSDPELD